MNNTIASEQTPEVMAMVAALLQLRQALIHCPLPLEGDGVDEARASRQEMVDQLDDYLIPRVMSIDAPLLVVVGGSTGAGKSTLVNSLVGHRATEPGVLRPTTRSPVLVHHSHDAVWFGQDRLLPELKRVTSHSNDPGAVQLVESDSVPAGLAILDAPDVDSVEEQNRVLAAHLLSAGDLWLFVTSAARYADQVPWDYLKRAAERSAAVAIVLDRTPEDAVDTVSSHLQRMLASRGLKDSPLFIVHEGPISPDGLLPPDYVSEIRDWLVALAGDARASNAVVQRTLDGAVRTVALRSYEVADAVAEQLTLRHQLRAEATKPYERALAKISAASADGTLLRGEVLARWQEFVGSGDVAKVLDRSATNWRDKLSTALKGKPPAFERIQTAIEAGLETLIQEHAEKAAERVSAAWRETPSGRALLQETGEDLGRASRDVRRRAERTVRDWQRGVVDMVRTESADKRVAARYAAVGVNGVAVALMMVLLTHQGGLAQGAVPGVASNGAVMGQRLLEAVFGAPQAQELVARVRKDLELRVFEVLKAERARYVDLLDVETWDAGAPDALREAVRRVDDLRFAETGYLRGKA